MANNKYKEFGVNATIFAISVFLSKLVSSILVPVYTRTMSTEEYGTADLVTMISHFIVPICSITIHEAVYRYSADQRFSHKDVIRCGINIAWLSSISMIIVGIIVGFYNPVSNWIVYLIAISIFTMFRNILSLYTEAHGRVLLFGIDTIICNFVLGVANIVLLVTLSMGIKGYFFATLISLGASIVLLSFMGKIHLFPRIRSNDLTIIKPMVQYSAPMVFNSISWILMSIIDRIMLTSLYTTSANGIYAVASKVPTLVTVLTNAFTQAWGLSLVKSFENDLDNDFNHSIFELFHLSVLFGTSLIMLFTNNFLQVIIGEEFSHAVTYIPTLLVGAFFLSYTSFYSSIYSAAKKTTKIATTSAMGLLVNVLLNAFLIPHIGIMGACIATTASYIAIAFFRIVDCKQYIDIKFNIPKWMCSIMLLVLQGFFVSTGYYDVLVSIIILLLLGLMHYQQIVTILKLVIRIVKTRGRKEV